MQRIKCKAGVSGVLIKNRWFGILKSQKGSCNSGEFMSKKLLCDVGSAGFASMSAGRNAVDTGITETVKTVVLKSNLGGRTPAAANWIKKDVAMADGTPSLFRGRQTREPIVGLPALCRYNQYYGGCHMLPFARFLATSSASQSSRQTPQEQHRKDISTVDDPFDAPTYNIPEKPVTFAEGASYSVIILAGLGIAAAAGYAVFKELIFEPKEYKIFGKALERVQNDGQVRVRIGSPVTGYGQESRNRAARQRIPNRTWTDEDGIERVEVNFYIRGPHGAGKVYTEMFKDKVDKQWKFTYLIVEIKSPSPAQLMLESYVPA